MSSPKDNPPFTFSPTFSIPTERLHISYFLPDSPTHCAFLCRVWNTDTFIESCGKTGINTPENAAQFLKNNVTSDFTRNHHGLYLVSRKLYPDAPLSESVPVGTVSLMRGEAPNAYLVPDIGYSMLPEESGKGYASEAGRGLIEYARRELGIQGVFGFCGRDDSRSRRVLEKIGLEFRGERRLRVFGGKESAVFASRVMSLDLKEYGLDD